MGKTIDNKKQKLDNLFNAAFELFTSQGINRTSISDITQKAGVAKGTFYLYFKDKYDLRNKLIVHRANQLFVNAYEASVKENINNFEEEIIFIMNYVLDDLIKNKGFLAFIYKDLSWALFKKALAIPLEDNVSFVDMYNSMLEKSEIKFRDPEIMIFMILDLVGSAGYSAIVYEEPTNINVLRNHLENTVRTIIHQYIIEE